MTTIHGACDMTVSKKWWLSFWWDGDDMGMFELHTPWWTSGERDDGARQSKLLMRKRHSAWNSHPLPDRSPDWSEAMKTPKMRHCFNCGAEICVYADHDPLDDCGSMECRRAARDTIAEQREEAHEKLDRDNGWN